MASPQADLSTRPREVGIAPRVEEIPRPSRLRLAASRLGSLLLRLLGPVVATLALVLFWWWASGRYNSILFPGPADTASRAQDLINSGELRVNVVASLKRILLGFVIGSVGGALLGLAIGASNFLRALFHGPVQFFRFVPAIAWLTPAIIWFGIGETSKVLLIVYTTSFVVAIAAIAGCEGITENKLRAARSFGAGRVQVFRYVVVPGALSGILTGMRIAMGNSFMTIVAAEMLAAQSGLGFLIISSRTFLDVETIFVAIIVLGILGIIVDRILALLIRKFASRYYVEVAMR